MFHETTKRPADPDPVGRAINPPPPQIRTGTVPNANGASEPLTVHPGPPLRDRARTPVMETDALERGPGARSPGSGEPTPNAPDWFETFERGIAATWHGAEGSILNTLGSARANVRRGTTTVQTTARAVQGVIRDTTEAAGWILNVPAHVRSHPWLAMGGAFLLGVALGRLSGRLGRTGAPRPTERAARPPWRP